MSVSIPDEGRLPPGPLRDLTEAIHELYALAGKPGTRKISDAIKDRDDLPDTASHEAVRNVLRGVRVGWPKIQSVVSQLAAWAVTKPEPAQEIKRFHQLWIAIEEYPALQSPPARGDRISAGGPSPIPLNAPVATPQDDQNSNYAENSTTFRIPLVSWRTPAGTLDVYDRQMAIQLIRDIGAPND